MNSNSRSARIILSSGVAVALIFAGTGASSYAAAAARLTHFNISAFSVLAGATTMAVVTLDSVTASSVTQVTFRSSNTAVATIPSSRSILGTSMPVPVTAVAPGCVRITATLGARTSSDEIVVQPAAKTSSFTFSISDPMVILGAGRDATVNKPITLTTSPTRDATVSGDLSSVTIPYVALGSSNPAIASVPERVTLTSGRATFKVKGVSPGCATITARIGTETLSKTVQVVDIGG
jgi:hypothetical protein